ncbi:creatininase family protein [Methylocella sp.]|uniref:creatininase family protein n=1 Tax=Methylocella sp. TaxID=1978226 RepID=UPI0035B30B7F
MLPTRLWSEMRWTDFQAADMSQVIAVLPLAAVEQHGPHLPVGVDAFIMEGYLERVRQRLPPELPVLFLPTQTCGCSVEHMSFPGALSLSAPAALRAWTELGECVHRSGCRKLVLLNSHGGNSALLTLIAHDLRARLRMFVAMASWSRFGAPDGLFDEEEKLHGVHAGDVETSLMLSFRPDLARMDEAENFPPESLAFEAEFNWLRAGRPTGFGWMSQDLSQSGAMGRADEATARKGEACADYGATAFVEFLQDVEGFDLARLRKGPLDPEPFD